MVVANSLSGSILQGLGGAMIGTGIVVIVVVVVRIGMDLEKKYEQLKARRQVRRGEPRSLKRKRK